MEVAAAREQRRGELRRVQRGRGRVGDVVDEVAAAVGAVGDEGAAGRGAGHPPDAAVSTPLARRRSTLSVPKSSGPTQPIIAVAAPTRAAWSAKIAGAPLG